MICKDCIHNTVCCEKEEDRQALKFCSDYFNLTKELKKELENIKAKIEKEKEPYITMWETGFDDVSYGKYCAYRKAIGFIVKRIDELEGETNES